MDKSKKISICSDCKKDMKQNYFVEFHIVQGGGGGGNILTFNLPLANSTLDRQVGNCLFLTLKTFLGLKMFCFQFLDILVKVSADCIILTRLCYLDPLTNTFLNCTFGVYKGKHYFACFCSKTYITY